MTTIQKPWTASRLILTAIPSLWTMRALTRCRQFNQTSLCCSSTASSFFLSSWGAFFSSSNN